LGNASVRVARFEELAAADARFDVITFVASLHHLSLVPALTTARQLLRPGGELAVVGLAANRSLADWLWSGLCLPAVRVGSALHRETRDIGVAVAEPGEGLAEIRRLAGELLPGVVVRRGLYYRYLLRWRKSVVGAA
jgi:2-polyprenyl-3-methyl-5-hydroxy-6-metoxy-1,4-benzoquinol methylase